MLTTVDMDPHQFIELGAGYVLLKQRIPAQTEVTIGDVIPMSGMLETRWLMQGTVRVGYYFTTQFKAMNGGGYLVAFIESKRGTATTAETLLKIKDELVMFHFPNRGTMAISPVIGEEIISIFAEQ